MTSSSAKEEAIFSSSIETGRLEGVMQFATSGGTGAVPSEFGRPP